MNHGTALGIALLFLAGCGESKDSGPANDNESKQPVEIQLSTERPEPSRDEGPGELSTIAPDAATEIPNPEQDAMSAIEALGGKFDWEDASLDLGFRQITDAALKHLSGLASLERLCLVDILVTDAGLKHLIGLSGLRHLNLIGTKVTDIGHENLKAALPE